MSDQQVTRSPSSQSLSATVYEQILAAIMDGTYEVNSKLPTEAQLCKVYQVSRPILREALSRLREDKLIASRRGSGSFVLKRPDEAVLQFARLSSIADIQRCFEFRCALESEAAGLAAIRRTPEQLLKIRSAFEAIKIANESSLPAVDEDFYFHLAIVEASNNHFYSTVTRSLEKSVKEGLNITRNLSLMHSVSRLELVQREHEAIVEAIEAADADAAKNAMKTHLDNARSRMFDGIPT